VVWEEAIILLPDACQSAFLSATIPNALEFAQWVANLHKKKCHVVYTDYRPVPLQHFIMPCGGEKAPLYCVVRQLNFTLPLCTSISPPRASPKLAHSCHAQHVITDIDAVPEGWHSRIHCTSEGVRMNKYHQILMHCKCMRTAYFQPCLTLARWQIGTFSNVA
jgi:hypothetical protein